MLPIIKNLVFSNSTVITCEIEKKDDKKINRVIENFCMVKMGF
jgi:hypothetical protein